MSRHRQYPSLDYPIGWTALFQKPEPYLWFLDQIMLEAPMEAGLFNFISKQYPSPFLCCLMLDHVTSLLPQQACVRSQLCVPSGPWACHGISLYSTVYLFLSATVYWDFSRGKRLGHFVSFHIPDTWQTPMKKNSFSSQPKTHFPELSSFSTSTCWGQAFLRLQKTSELSWDSEKLL